jgi:UDP-N-acetylglucosamine acyltransferase
MISKLANISSDAQIGKNVRIDSFTTIYENVIIGDDSIIHPNVTIYPGARIGKGVEIYPGAVISAIPQDLKFDGEDTTVEIGDNTVIRECVTIHKGTSDKWKTSIGSNCLIMTYVHIAHDCQIGNNVILASYVGLSGHTIIDDYAILEGKVGTQQFARVGKHAFVAGASLIRKNVPPFVRVAREPLTFVGVNSIGLRRRGYTEEQTKEVEDIYRVLFVNNKSVNKGIEAVKNELPDSPLRKEILDFIESSAERGIVKRES